MEQLEEVGNEGSAPRSPLAGFAEDSRAGARERLAEAAATLALRSVDSAERLIRELCADASLRVRMAAARSLAAVLAAAPPLLRLEIVSRWALSPRAAERAAMARALCREMGMTVIAEGVEAPEERDVLVGLGCDLLQGHLFAKPGPPFPEARW